MTRIAPSLALAGMVWAGSLVAIVLTAPLTGWSTVAHDYFAGWLVAISLPLGALPLLMVLDLLDAPETPTRSMLRLLLAALPVLALLVVPALLDLSGVFPWPLAPASAAPLKGFARSWYTPGFFGLRAMVYLVAWCALALFFVRPAPASSRHATIAGAGLALHLVIGTLAAFDWWMSLDMAFVSSAYGLLVIAAQAVFALVVAALMAFAFDRAAQPERPVLLAVLVGLLVAAFIQFAQYLVVWSANLPREIAWYQARWGGLLGPVSIIGLPILLMLAGALLILATLSTTRASAAIALATVLLVTILDLACLASPHGTFTVAGVALILAFVVAIGGLGAIGAAALAGRFAWGARHG